MGKYKFHISIRINLFGADKFQFPGHVIDHIHRKYGFSAGLMFSRKPMNKCSRRKKNR